jgi:diguanylate cyclase (GGDEF)-like protein
MAMINKLAMIEEKGELYQNILAMGAELVQASCGSLMLTDDGRQEMRIEATIRMNLHLARSLSVRVGSGIAGRVAESGHPLLVNDIEKDERVGEPNRPRFRTKSFISIPLKFKDTVLGVLNLSDKENNGIFTEADLEVLLSFVNPAAAMIHRTTAMERSELLERLSVTDPLTELHNRRFLQKRMEEELNRSSRNKLPLTVIFIDLDHFKLYNDLCGHVGGDRALKRSAKILLAAVREMDLVARFGGEEFCVILPGTSKKESLFVAERIRRSIEQEPFPSEEQLPLKRLTTSLGIAAFPEDGTTVNALINSADMALYQAKAQGRNRICLAAAQQLPSQSNALLT